MNKHFYLLLLENFQLFDIFSFASGARTHASLEYCIGSL